LIMAEVGSLKEERIEALVGESARMRGLWFPATTVWSMNDVGVTEWIADVIPIWLFYYTWVVPEYILDMSWGDFLNVELLFEV
jgi:hypothetical protein